MSSASTSSAAVARTKCWCGSWPKLTSTAVVVGPAEATAMGNAIVQGVGRSPMLGNGGLIGSSHWAYARWVISRTPDSTALMTCRRARSKTSRKTATPCCAAVAITGGGRRVPSRYPRGHRSRTQPLYYGPLEEAGHSNRQDVLQTRTVGLTGRLRRFSLAKRFGQIAADLLGVDGCTHVPRPIAVQRGRRRGLRPFHQDQYYFPLDGEEDRHDVDAARFRLPAEMGSLQSPSLAATGNGFLLQFSGSASHGRDETDPALIEEPWTANRDPTARSRR